MKLINKDIRPHLCSYMVGICRNLKITALAIGGIEDHVHCLLELPPTMTVPEAVNKLKSNSSGWMKRQKIKFAWQEGYSSFAVSASLLPRVRQYVLNQERHHRKMTYEDEIMALLRKHGIEADPKDVFD